MKKIVLLALLISACSDSKSSRVKPVIPVDRPAVSYPEPSQGKTNSPEPSKDHNERFKYSPAWLSPEWDKGTFFVGDEGPGGFGIRPGEEPIADSMFRYFEAIRENWAVSLNHGYVPTEYLSRVPSDVLWTDATGGKVPGFGKLKSTLDEMRSRCPSILDGSLLAPLEVVWATEKETELSGQFFQNWVKIRWNEGVKLTANTMLRPKLLVRAEYPRRDLTGKLTGYVYPNQTFREQSGGLSYADGGHVLWSVDETFAHEYGHYIIQAWALNNGRGMLQTEWFAEGWAELFKTVCWGGWSDNLDAAMENVEKNRVDGVPYQRRAEDYRTLVRGFSRGEQYMMLSLDDLIALQRAQGVFNPDAMFRAMVKTLGQMKGRFVDRYPVVSPIDGVLKDYAPWSTWDSYGHKEVRTDKGLLWTRGEFIELLCENYDCGEAEYIIKKDAEGLRVNEW